MTGIDWVDVIFTSLLSVAVMFLLARLMGHRQLSQFDIFDYINGITIGSIAAELATELESPIRPLIAMLVYGGAGIALNKLTARWNKSRKFINGSPTIIMDGGKIYRENLKQAKLDLSEFLVMCHQAGYFDLSQIQTAVFEYNGQMSFLPASTARPATPADLNLTPEQETIPVEIIMDGRVLHENLKRMGRELKWLEKQLTAQGYHGPEEVLLGQVTAQGNVTFYGMCAVQ